MKIFLMLFLLVVTGCKPQGSPPGPPFSSPLESDVKSISVQFTKTEKIEIPKSSYGSILNFLNGSAEDTNPKKWEVFGFMEIAHNTGTLQVELFNTGETLGAFSIDRIYYRGSSKEELNRIIESARKHKREQNAAEQPATAPQSKSK